MYHKRELVELYLEILAAGPGYGVDIEFWDPTLTAVELYDLLKEKVRR